MTVSQWVYCWLSILWLPRNPKACMATNKCDIHDPWSFNIAPENPCSKIKVQPSFFGSYVELPGCTTWNSDLRGVAPRSKLVIAILFETILGTCSWTEGGYLSCLDIPGLYLYIYIFPPSRFCAFFTGVLGPMHRVFLLWRCPTHE